MRGNPTTVALGPSAGEAAWRPYSVGDIVTFDRAPGVAVVMAVRYTFGELGERAWLKVSYPFMDPAKREDIGCTDIAASKVRLVEKVSRESMAVLDAYLDS